VLDAIDRLDGDVVAADVVELLPDADAVGTTARVGAALIKAIAARMLRE
jgi:arginase family enzyme